MLNDNKGVKITQDSKFEDSNMRKVPKVKYIKTDVRSSLNSSFLLNMGNEQFSMGRSLFFLGMLGVPCMNMHFFVASSLLNHLRRVERQGRQTPLQPQSLPCSPAGQLQSLHTHSRLTDFPPASSSGMAALNLHSWSGTDYTCMLQHCSLLLTKCT